MPASKQRSQSPAARGADAPSRAARSPSPALIKARHNRYKEVSGSTPWMPDLQNACELAAVVFLLLPGFFMDSLSETTWAQAALQRFCVFMTGACVLGRFLFAVPLPVTSISVTPDRNDRLIAHEHESASQLETALELAMPEVSGDKENSAYYVKSPGKGVKGLWYQPGNQAPLFVPCAELLAEGADRYTILEDEVKQHETELFATNPSVQKSNLEAKLKKQWTAAATRVEQIVFAIYGLLGFAVLQPAHGFSMRSILALILAGAFAVFLHIVGLGLNDQPVDLNVQGMAIKLPAALWKRDLNARKSVRRSHVDWRAVNCLPVPSASILTMDCGILLLLCALQGNAPVITTLKGTGRAMRSAALGIAGAATVIRPLFVLQELRELAEWLPKDLVLMAFEIVVEVAQHLFRLTYLL